MLKLYLSTQKIYAPLSYYPSLHNSIQISMSRKKSFWLLCEKRSLKNVSKREKITNKNSFCFVGWMQNMFFERKSRAWGKKLTESCDSMHKDLLWNLDRILPKTFFPLTVVKFHVDIQNFSKNPCIEFPIPTFAGCIDYPKICFSFEVCKLLTGKF